MLSLVILMHVTSLYNHGIHDFHDIQAIPANKVCFLEWDLNHQLSGPMMIYQLNYQSRMHSKLQNVKIWLLQWQTLHNPTRIPEFRIAIWQEVYSTMIQLWQIALCSMSTDYWLHIYRYPCIVYIPLPDSANS